MRAGFLSKEAIRLTLTFLPDCKEATGQAPPREAWATSVTGRGSAPRYSAVNFHLGWRLGGTPRRAPFWGFSVPIIRGNAKAMDTGLWIKRKGVKTARSARSKLSCLRRPSPRWLSATRCPAGHLFEWHVLIRPHMSCASYLNDHFKSGRAYLYVPIWERETSVLLYFTRLLC